MTEQLHSICVKCLNTSTYTRAPVPVAYPICSTEGLRCCVCGRQTIGGAFIYAKDAPSNCVGEYECDANIHYWLETNRNHAKVHYSSGGQIDRIGGTRPYLWRKERGEDDADAHRNNLV